jgi:hypothetical protein
MPQILAAIIQRQDAVDNLLVHVINIDCNFLVVVAGLG